MSTATHSLDEVQGRDEADRIFRRYVFTDPSCCSNCFRRIKSDHRRVMWGTEGRDKDPKATRAAVEREHRTGQHEAGPEGPILSYNEAGAENGEVAIYPTRTVCEDCGAIAGRADDQSLSQREAVQRAETLADRLTELGEPVSLKVLKHLVAHLKTVDDVSSHDTECFEAATTIAVRSARRNR